MDLGAQQDISAPDVDMDAGAQPDAPDTGAPVSGAGTAEDAGAGDKSAGIEKGKAPEVQKSGLTRYLLLLDKLHRPRWNNQHPRLQPLKRPLSRPSPALSR
jgi:hypothetical protein